MEPGSGAQEPSSQQRWRLGFWSHAALCALAVFAVWALLVYARRWLPPSWQQAHVQWLPGRDTWVAAFAGFHRHAGTTALVLAVFFAFTTKSAAGIRRIVAAGLFALAEAAFFITGTLFNLATGHALLTAPSFWIMGAAWAEILLIGGLRAFLGERKENAIPG